MAITATLVVATAVSIWLAIRASHAEKQATRHLSESEEARREAAEISKFLVEVFQSADPGKQGRTITVAETLGKAAARIDRDFAARPELQARLREAIATTYLSLGLYQESNKLEENALKFRQDKLGPEHEDTLRAMENLATASFANVHEPGGWPSAKIKTIVLFNCL